MSVTELQGLAIITSLTVSYGVFLPSLSHWRTLPGGGAGPESEAPPVLLTVLPAHCDGVGGAEMGDGEGREGEGQAGQQQVSAALCWTSPDVEELHSDQTGVLLPAASNKENIEQI